MFKLQLDSLFTVGECYWGPLTTIYIGHIVIVTIFMLHQLAPSSTGTEISLIVIFEGINCGLPSNCEICEIQKFVHIK